MVRKGGGPVAELLGTGLSMGTSYYAYKNSDSYGGFLWLRFYYGFMFLLFVAAIIGIPIVLFMLFAKKTPMKTPPPPSVPVQPSK
jgi:hypothetical protein